MSAAPPCPRAQVPLRAFPASGFQFHPVGCGEERTASSTCRTAVRFATAHRTLQGYRRLQAELGEYLKAAGGGQ